MRRLLQLSLGLLELAIAILLAWFAWQLPGPAAVERASDRVERVSATTGRQVRDLEASLARARARQPELRMLASRVQKQMGVVNQTVHRRHFTGAALPALGESLGHVAGGLDGLSTLLAAEGMQHMARGLGTTADYLDTKVIATTEKGAANLEKATAGLKADAARLAALLKDRPIELKAARNAADNLKRFEEGLTAMQKVFKLDGLDAMHEGIQGMETSLTTAAGQVDKFADYTIPRVSFKGLQIMVENEDLWPEGKTIAAGMRKAAKGCKVAAAEIAAARKEVPKLRASLQESHKALKNTRQGLEAAMADEKAIAPLLQRLPLTLARLAEALPDLSTELAKALRETGRLKEVAAAMRQAQRSLDIAAKRWPGLSQELTKAAQVLRTTQKQLEGALDHREQFEAALRRTVELTSLYTDSLPNLVEELDDGLARQQRSLSELGANLDQFRAEVPPAARSVGRLLGTVRLLAALVAMLVVIHAGHRFFLALPRAAPKEAATASAP